MERKETKLFEQEYDVGEKIVFSIFVRPNESLIMELERLGSRIEVLSPEPVRRKLAENAMLVLEQYRHTGEVHTDDK